MKLAFIGGGNMGTAILSAALEKGLAKPGEITVTDISEERLDFLEGKYGVSVSVDKSLAVKEKDVVIFSIKPQNVPEVLPEIKGKLNPDQLVLSIMAGITVQTLKEGLDHKSIVRVMPNMPAQVFEGMSGWTATPDVTETQKALVGSILESIGRQIYFDDESFLDMVTALSGSGPAYFFRFAEAMIEAGVQIGFSYDVAYELTLQTMTGAGKLMRETGTSPAELRKMVTSKGGTTAAAFDVLDTGKFGELIVQAVKAAYNRSVELGGGK